VTTVLKDAFTAISAVAAGRFKPEADFLRYYSLIRDELNGTRAGK
jgi:hypothetical protein